MSDFTHFFSCFTNLQCLIAKANYLFLSSVKKFFTFNCTLIKSPLLHLLGPYWCWLVSREAIFLSLNQETSFVETNSTL